MVGVLVRMNSCIRFSIIERMPERTWVTWIMWHDPGAWDLKIHSWYSMSPHNIDVSTKSVNSSVWLPHWNCRFRFGMFKSSLTFGPKRYCHCQVLCFCWNRILLFIFEIETSPWKHGFEYQKFSSIMDSQTRSNLKVRRTSYFDWISVGWNLNWPHAVNLYEYESKESLDKWVDQVKRGRFWSMRAKTC